VTIDAAVTRQTIHATRTVNRVEVTVGGAAGPASINAPTFGITNHELNVRDHGVTGDGTTDDRDAIQAVLNASAGNRAIRFPRGRYRLGTPGAATPNRIVVPSGAHIACDAGAVFEVNALDWQTGASIFYVAGTAATKTAMAADTAAGAQTVTVPAGLGAGYGWGDLVGIEAAAGVGIGTDGNPFFAREIRRVVGVAGDVVELDAPLEYAYTVAAGAHVWRITPAANVLFEGPVFEAGPGAENEDLGSYAITVARALNCRILGAELHNMTGGIRLHDAYDTTVDDLTVNSLRRYELVYGDGLIAGGSTTNLRVHGLRGRDTRHIFTTLADERAGPSTFWGGPMHVEVSDGIGYGAVAGYSVWDTHEFGRHLHFDNCQAIGGGPAVTGYQIRAQDVQLTNCRAIRCGLHGVAARANSRNVQILGGEFAYNGSNGVVLNGADGHLEGARVHHNAAAGINVAAATAVDNRIANAKLYANQFGINDGNLSTRTTVQGCEIPKSTEQTVAVVQPSATALIVGNAHLGYGNGQHGITSATSGCRIAGLVTDSAIVNNLGLNVGSLGGGLSFAELLYRAAAGLVRTDAALRATSFSVNGGPSILTGSAAPEGATTATVGTIYLRTGGAAGTTFYVKESGTGNTGWVAK
jgi:hypothetical protein